MKAVDFCTCVDHACRHHPSNHGGGCTPCIIKNLAAKEVPVCFYRKLEPDMAREQDYSFEGFARFVRERTSERQ